MKAKVKATGEIVDVHNTPDYPDVWYGAGLLPYGTRELEFIAYSRSLNDGLLAQFSDQELREELKKIVLISVKQPIFFSVVEIANTVEKDAVIKAADTRPLCVS